MTIQQYHGHNIGWSQNEQWYYNLYEDSPDLYCTVNNEGIIIECNKSYADNVGHLREKLIGKSIFDHIARNNLRTMHTYFEEWKQTGKVFNKEVFLKRKNSTIFPVLLSASSVYDKGSNIVACSIAMKDISEMIRHREKIQEHELQIQIAMNELKKANVARDQFLAMITHELKTPLVPIKGYTDLLLSCKFGPLNELQRPRLETIKSCSDTMLKLISDLLDVQKLELGKLRLNKGDYNLSEVITSAIEKIKPTAERSGIVITTDLESDLVFLCDKTRIQQVIINLLYNSLDFCQKQIGKIELKMFADKEGIKIIVKDNGIGIPKEKQEKLFTKFYQADTSPTREHGGSGLGLSICKGIIDNHGGKIWAHSNGLGKGTEIHILFSGKQTKS
jgi:PAS domain S-box-containing protein